jgi:hypothetical protein
MEACLKGKHSRTLKELKKKQKIMINEMIMKKYKEKANHEY